MIRIYDTNRQFLCLMDVCKDAYTEETMRTGTRTLNFKVPCSIENFKNIQEEYYVETNDYMYIIKEIMNLQRLFVMRIRKIQMVI